MKNLGSGGVGKSGLGSGEVGEPGFNAVESLVSLTPELPDRRASVRRDPERRWVLLDLLEVSGPERHLKADCPLDDGESTLDVRLEANRKREGI